MIPIVPADVLSKNPLFERIYQDIIKNKLNQDGSSRLSAEAAKQKEEVNKRLTAIREEAVKSKIIQYRLAHILDELPSDLQEVVDLFISAQNTGAVLRKDDEAFFQEGLPLICKSLSKILLQDAQDLATMCSTTTADSQTNPVPIKDLPTHLSNRLSALETDYQHLYSLRTATLSHQSTLAALHNQIISTTIRLIESTKHGLASRAQRTHAHHLNLFAESSDGKLKVMYYEALERMYDPDTVDTLEFYKEHLEDVKTKWKREIRRCEEALEGFEAESGVAGRREQVERYAKVLGEIEGVKEDIKRLRGGGDDDDDDDDGY